MKINLLKNLFLFISIITIMSFLNGCHTVAGLGKDVQIGGQALEKAAKQDNNGQNNGGQNNNGKTADKK